MLLRLFFGFFWLKLQNLHTGTPLFKIRTSFELAILLTPATYIIERLSEWTLANAVYIGWVLWAILVDWIVGVWVHLKRGDFSWGKNALGLTLKIGMALFAGSLFEALPYFLKHDNIVSQILLIVTRLAVFLYPAGSAFTNMAEITNGKFPPVGLFKRINMFNNDLDLKAFKQKENDNFNNYENEETNDGRQG